MLDAYGKAETTMRCDIPVRTRLGDLPESCAYENFKGSATCGYRLFRVYDFREKHGERYAKRKAVHKALLSHPELAPYFAESPHLEICDDVNYVSESAYRGMRSGAQLTTDEGHWRKFTVAYLEMLKVLHHYDIVGVTAGNMRFGGTDFNLITSRLEEVKSVFYLNYSQKRQHKDSDLSSLFDELTRPYLSAKPAMEIPQVIRDFGGMIREPGPIDYDRYIAMFRSD